MKLSEYFDLPLEKFIKATPETGERSEWLDFCELELKGSHFLVVDAQFAPAEKDGLLVKLPPAIYQIQVQVTNYGGERRISRLRAFIAGGTPQTGGILGETWTDTAAMGICDFETFSKAWGTDSEASRNIIEPFFEAGEEFGVAVLDPVSGASMPFVQSGFGDGTFSVFELTDGVRRTGLEIEFIPGDAKYPFGETPYQRQTRIAAIEEGARQGDAKAQLQLARMYRAGQEVEKNLETAAGWYEKASQNGSAEAAHALGVMYRLGKGRPQDFSQAKELFELAVSRGSAAALYELGVMHRNGQGVGVDNEKAIIFYRQAADLGVSNAQYNLAVHYTNGWGIAKNYEEAARWLRLAADQGNLNAICNLGYFYSQGMGVPKDGQEAKKLFMRGFASNHAMSANNLGDCYENGIGVEIDLKKALRFYSAASRNGLPLAKMNVGVLYKKGGPGIEKNSELALKWLREASMEGNARAHYELGLMYETGDGVETDLVAACKLYQKAHDGGFAEAAGRLKELMAAMTEAEQRAAKQINPL